MERKQNTIALIGGLLAIFGGVLIIIGAFMGDAFPKVLWIVAAICQFGNAFTMLRYVRSPNKNNDKGK